MPNIVRWAALSLAVAFSSSAALAALETDPAALYATMKKAYDAGVAHGMTFRDQQYYLSTVFDAGRSYALRRPDDPAYGELAQLTVTVASGLHYDPLLSADAARWYVREAASYVIAHNPEDAPKARDLLARVEASESDLSVAARFADLDATANAHLWAADADALVQQVQADLRAYRLTRDVVYRSLALQRAAAPSFPVTRVPDPDGADLFALARAASDNVAGFSAMEIESAREILRRRAAAPKLAVIGKVTALTHEARLTAMAPADEYFGRQRLSPIGIRNELIRVNNYLDAGWGERMSSAAGSLADAVDDWHRQYPRDSALPAALYDSYRLLARIDSADAKQNAERVKRILVTEYIQSRQARLLLGA